MDKMGLGDVVDAISSAAAGARKPKRARASVQPLPVGNRRAVHARLANETFPKAPQAAGLLPKSVYLRPHLTTEVFHTLS